MRNLTSLTVFANVRIRQRPSENGPENEVTALQETSTESSQMDELKEKEKAPTNGWFYVSIARSLGNVSHLPFDQKLAAVVDGVREENGTG